MKKLILILALMLFYVSYANILSNDGGSLHIYTNAYQSYVPNTVEITFSIETEDKSAQIASDKNKEIANKALDAVKKHLTDKDMVRTSGFNVSAQYNWVNNKRTFENYRAINTFMVRLKDTSKLGDVINSAMQAGVTRVGDLNYSLEETDGYCTELISRAGKTAKERANTIAKTMGYRVTGLKNASTSCSVEGQSSYSRYNSVMMSAKSMDSAEGVSVPAESGTLKINASFNGDFIIK